MIPGCRLYRVGPEWYEDADIRTAPEISADSHGEAAEECVRLNYANYDYPNSINMKVIGFGESKPKVYTVERVLAFTSYEVDE